MPSDVNNAASPIEQFIIDSIQPRRYLMNQWQDVLKHQDILLEDAQKRRRATAAKLGSGFLLKRDSQRIGGLDAGVTTLVSGQALKATQTLQLCHEYLRASKVPTVLGRHFHVTDRAAAVTYQREHGDVVIRPGVYLGRPVVSLSASSVEELITVWDRSSAALDHLRSSRQQVYVEPRSHKLSLRLFVVGEDVVAAIVRVPFYLIGDGSSSVAELIEAERTRRAGCEYLGRRFPKIDEEHLATMDLTSDQVLAGGAIRLLAADPPGAASGGLGVDVLAELGDELKGLAIDAMWAFPGLSATAVDIQTPTLESATGALVADVVPQANHSEFTYPAYGEARRCGKVMVDHMILSR